MNLNLSLTLLDVKLVNNYDYPIYFEPFQQSSLNKCLNELIKSLDVRLMQDFVVA